MPPAIKDKKSKGREGRRSRSRNTTPSSIASAPLASTIPSHTSYLDIPIDNLMVPTNISYDDILERHGGSGGIPDPSHLTTMVKDLKQLCELASARNDTCNLGMRALAERRKQALDDERDREREQAARAREAEDIENLKKEAEEEEEEEDIRGCKASIPKKQTKEPSSVRKERPLAHGARGLARQDGLDLPLKGESIAPPSCGRCVAFFYRKALYMRIQQIIRVSLLYMPLSSTLHFTLDILLAYYLRTLS